MEVRNVYKKLGSVDVLRGVDLDIDRGEIVVLLGASGGGKSTLLRCVNGLIMPTSGHVLVDGELIGRKVLHGKLHPVRESVLNRQRQMIGMVFQHFNVFSHLNVIDNLLLAPRTLGRGSYKQLVERAMQELARVGLADKAQSYPSQLSGGQQQRVAIARALMLDPKLMLFDEPTSALDPRLVSEVQESIQRLADEGMTMLIVTHEMGFARRVANRISFMSEGKIIEQGTPDIFFSQPATEEARRFFELA